MSVRTARTRSEPLVSVLLPLYQPGAELAACLESVLAQSMTDFELLAILDGPDDRALHILSRFDDRRLQVLSLPERQGIVAALNHGLEQAKGRFIARIDHDDRMLPSRLAKQVAFSKELPSPFLLGTLVELIGEEAQSPGRRAFIARQNSLTDHQQMTARLYQDSPLNHPSLFAERDFLLQLGGYQDNPWAEDLDLYFRAYLAGALFAKVPEVLTQKGVGPGQTTKTDPRCRREALFQAKLHYLKQDPRYRGKSRFYLLGTGPSAQKLIEAMKAEGMELAGFVEHRPTPKKDRVKGYPLFTLQELQPRKEELILIVTGNWSAQKQIETLLADLEKEVLWML